MQKIFGTNFLTGSYEESRSYGKAWQDMFAGDITPELVKLICVYKNTGNKEVLLRIIDKIKEEIPRWASVNDPVLKSMFLAVYEDIWDRMDDEEPGIWGCSDPEGLANAINDLAKVNITKAPTTAE
jgi:hypothetical protein